VLHFYAEYQAARKPELFSLKMYEKEGLMLLRTTTISTTYTTILESSFSVNLLILTLTHFIHIHLEITLESKENS
jgi:hypothetical protein